jgi:hypothetical protein
MYEIKDPVFFKPTTFLDACARMSTSITLADVEIDANDVEDPDDLHHFEDLYDCDTNEAIL